MNKDKRYLDIRLPHIRLPLPDLAALRRWLPTRGNVLFTVFAIAALLGLNRAGALSLAAPVTGPQASTNTIAYQGRIANAGGTPLTGTYSMVFRLYNIAAGGAPLWEETWTGANGVKVSDGLFNVMLGSLTSIPPSIVSANASLWLGITVGTDSEMSPRVQLGSVPFSMQALTVPDGSITSSKLNLDDGFTVSGNITTTGNLALGGRLDGPHSYWADYRSYIRFMKSNGATNAALCPEGGVPTGVTSPLQSLQLKTGHEIAQARFGSAGTCVNVHRLAPCGTIIGDHYPYDPLSCNSEFSGTWAPFYWWNGDWGGITTGILDSGVGCYSVQYACVQ